MRYLLNIFLLLLISIPSYAQFEAGFLVGIGSTHLNVRQGNVSVPSQTHTYSPGVGLTMGGFLGYGLVRDLLSVRGSLQITQKGAVLNTHHRDLYGQLYAISKSREDAYYLEVPLLLQLDILPWLTLQGGMYNALAMPMRFSDFASTSGRYFEGIPAYDLGYMAGLAFVRNHFSIELMYSGGARSSVIRSILSATNHYGISNRTLFLSLGYRISGAGVQKPSTP